LIKVTTVYRSLQAGLSVVYFSASFAPFFNTLNTLQWYSQKTKDHIFV